MPQAVSGGSALQPEKQRYRERQKEKKEKETQKERFFGTGAVSIRINYGTTC